jgi:hypothetical protein
MNGNGYPRRPGRPALRFGEPSEVVTIRFPRSDFDLLDGQARKLGISIAELIRRVPAILQQMQAQIDQLQNDMDEVMNHFIARMSPEENSLTYMRLLMARAQTTSNESAVRLFLQECQTDIHAPIIWRFLDKFREANRRHPGSVTDDQLWNAIGMGNVFPSGPRPWAGSEPTNDR